MIYRIWCFFLYQHFSVSRHIAILKSYPFPPTTYISEAESSKGRNYFSQIMSVNKYANKLFKYQNHTTSMRLSYRPRLGKMKEDGIGWNKPSSILIFVYSTLNYIDESMRSEQFLLSVSQCPVARGIERLPAIRCVSVYTTTIMSVNKGN